MKLSLSSLAIGLATLTLTVTAQAQQIGPGAFDGGATVVTYDGLGLPFYSSTPLVISGDTYNTDTNTLRYLNYFGNYMGLSGGAIGTDSDLGYIDITLGTPATMVGGYMGVDSAWTATTTFYDASNVLLGTVITSGNGNDNAFAGWESAGDPIARIRVQDTETNGRIILFKNLTTENSAVPEPGTYAMIGSLGLTGAAFLRRRRAR